MPLKIYKRGAVWHYRGSVAGRRLRGSTSATVKEIASRVAAEIEAREWKRRLEGPEAVLTFAQAAILYRAAGKSPRFLEPVEDFWQDALVKDINPGLIRRCAMTLYPNASGATRNRQVIVPTAAIINHAAESELCARIKVKRFPTVRKIKKPATLEWVKAFMAASPPHLAALALFMLLTGARVSEALSLQWSEVDMEARTALIRETKIGNERRAHLPSPLIVALANIKRENGRSVFRYTTKAAADKSWRSAVRRAKLEQLSFHSCRHGFATALLHAGVDPVTVAKLGGWKTPQHVFQTYGHASNDATLTDRIVDTKSAQGGGRKGKKPDRTGTS